MSVRWYSEDPRLKTQVDYSGSDNHKIETAFAAGKPSIDLNIAGNTFTIDFKLMVQKNSRGGKRPVKRAGPPLMTGGGVGGRTNGHNTPPPAVVNSGPVTKPIGGKAPGGGGGGPAKDYGKLGGGGKTSTTSTGGGASSGNAPTDPFEALIENEIVTRNPNVAWDDVASLTEAKRLLNEAVVLPLLMPSFFTGVCAPWKGVLLYGPPGTGKTLLAKAVATSGKTTFFNMSSSVLLSRFHGESEKMVRALFNKAREYSPSTVFFDEVDALVSARGANEHEASRRVKTEMLMQIDGVSSVGEQRVMLLATTNRPWDIDEAMRRRLEKRIYVPLPDAEARAELLKMYTKSLNLDPGVNFAELIAYTDGYSGADVQIMCRDAAMMPMRRAIEGLPPDQLAEKAAELEKTKAQLVVLHEDFVCAITQVKPSVSKADLKRYEEWTKEFGST